MKLICAVRGSLTLQQIMVQKELDALTRQSSELQANREHLAEQLAAATTEAKAATSLRVCHRIGVTVVVL